MKTLALARFSLPVARCPLPVSCLLFLLTSAFSPKLSDPPDVSLQVREVPMRKVHWVAALAALTSSTLLPRDAKA